MQKNDTIKMLMSTYENLPHVPHSITRGANTAANDLKLSGDEHRELIKLCSDHIGSHTLITKRLNKTMVSRHLPASTDPSMVRKLVNSGAYITQIELTHGGETFHFQGISSDKRNSISMSYLIANAGIKKLQSPSGGSNN